MKQVSIRLGKKKEKDIVGGSQESQGNNNFNHLKRLKWLDRRTSEKGLNWLS